jgi:hypothetical protein
MKPPVYKVLCVGVDETQPGGPVGVVTLECSIEAAQAAGAMLYQQVSLQAVEPEASSVASAMPGTATYDLDSEDDYDRWLDVLSGVTTTVRAHTVLGSQDSWHLALGHPAPRTLRELLGNTQADLLSLRGLGPGTLREIREALVEAGLPDLKEA